MKFFRALACETFSGHLNGPILAITNKHLILNQNFGFLPLQIGMYDDGII